MRVVVVGAGPVGLFSGMVLARVGHQVVVVDRDPPPPPVGAWERRGVMQFNLPHFFRHLVRQTLLASLPDVWEALVAAGGVPARPDGFPEEMTGLQSRRSTFERALWSVAATEHNLSIRTGHAQRIIAAGDKVGGVVIDGSDVPADLVVVAAGRSGRVGDEYRAPGDGGACGFSYAARMYRAKDGVATPSSATPIGSFYDGYQGVILPQDDRTLSALIERPSSDTALVPLRHNSCFQAAAAAIPNLAPWTDLERFEPITDAMAGSGLSNTYRGQLDEHGNVALSGLVFVGDAVSTTNPLVGRGVSLGLLQAAALLGFLGEASDDLRAASLAFETWTTEHIRPWFEDHVQWDATLLARFRGVDIDLDGPIPSDVICAAAEADPSMLPVVGPFLGMVINPVQLRAVEDKARDVLRTGWRPHYAAGPNGTELADIVAAAVPSSV
jgi:2-polyprenyl-6-methoxyphenol hydroxylase-like FAD-dependent oxidoreductase